MKFLKKLFAKKVVIPDIYTPFMEHPTGEFSCAMQAIHSAMVRLDKTDMGEHWLEFCAQGQGASPVQIQCESVLFNNRTFDLSGQTVDLELIMNSSGLRDAGVTVVTGSNGNITLAKATPEQLTDFLDTLFKLHFGIKPFEDTRDYSVGAEW